MPANNCKQMQCVERCSKQWLQLRSDLQQAQLLLCLLLLDCYTSYVFLSPSSTSDLLFLHIMQQSFAANNH